MKSLMLFLQYVFSDVNTWCSVSTMHDYNTVVRRVEKEGISFLTITLPTFAKDLETGLSRGFVDNDLFTGFGQRNRGGLPAFMRGFLCQIFDSDTGRLLDNPSSTAIWAVRQVTLMFGKILLPSTPAREKAAMDGYIECESQVALWRFTDEQEKSFSRISRLLFSDILERVDRDIREERIVPKHGPGATADRLRANAKYDLRDWTTRLEEVFPHMRYLFTSYSLALRAENEVNLREPGAELPVRVISVPKTLKTPRIIAIEPTCMQYMQQGILEAIVRAISATVDPVSLMINFEDQTPNQELARKGSLTGSLATLDLSEASDRVSNLHVELLLRGYGSLRRAVAATRSLTADVRGHGVIPLSKFASMGSALTFPMEAMVFVTCVFVGIEKVLRRRLTYKDVESFVGQVRVYGDDIIIPVEYAGSVVSTLEAFGFKVNSRKSFWNGKFRESCGREYYSGDDVSIVRVRRMFPEQRKDAQEWESLASLRNQLYIAGMWKSVRFVDDFWKGMGMPFPAVAPTSVGLGKFSYLGYETQRTGGRYQKPLVKAAVPVRRPPISRLDGEGALLKYFLKRGQDPFADRDHLERSGRPDSVNIKIRWTPSY